MDFSGAVTFAMLMAAQLTALIAVWDFHRAERASGGE
jgi:hypothetical protein